MAAGPEGRGLEEEKIGARVGGVECGGWGVSERTGEGSRVVGILSGIYTKENLVEFVELPTQMHPFYVGTQAHPELRSRPTNPHPLFVGLIAAALAIKNSK
jgi:hypothetical protein